MNPDIIIKNACVITAAGPVYENGFVHLKNGIVFSVGSFECMTHDARRMTVLDAKGRYVLPGFINAHMHLYSALARGMPVPRMTKFSEVLKGLWWPLDKALSIEDVRISAMLGGIEAIRSGTTTLIDHHASYGAVEGSLFEIAEAMNELKIRASLCYEISDRNGRKLRDKAIEESALWLDAARLINAKGDHTVAGMVGLHASMTVSDETLDVAAAMMSSFKVGAHVHVAEGIEDVLITKKKYKTTPARRFVDKGILKNGSLAIHCVHVDKKDIEALKKCGAYVVHNPMSNLNNAVGIAPIPEFARKKIPVAIGTDGMSAGIAADARLAAFLNKTNEKDAQSGGTEIKDALWNVAPRIASEMFGVKVGTIEKGAAADVIIIDAMPPTKVTSENAWWHVLYGVLNLPVRTTIINGKIRMLDFELVGIDEQKITSEAKKLAKKLWERVS